MLINLTNSTAMSFNCTYYIDWCKTYLIMNKSYTRNPIQANKPCAGEGSPSYSLNSMQVLLSIYINQLIKYIYFNTCLD